MATLLTLRADVAALLDDEQKDILADAGLDRVINMAYRRLVALVDRLSQAFNICQTPVTLTITSAAREYDLAPGDGVRAILEPAVRVDGTRRTPLPTVPYSERDTSYSLTAYPALGQFRQSREILYYYCTASGVFRVGVISVEPMDMTVEVFYLPAIAELINVGDVPTQVPTAHHDAITFLAVLLAKGGIEERDGTAIGNLYLQAVTDMRTTLARGPTARNRCQRL